MSSHPELDVFNCTACNEIGIGEDPTLDKHGHQIHKFCDKPRIETKHHLYEDCTFEYKNENNQGNDNTYCNACGHDITGKLYKGFNKEKVPIDTHLHVYCMTMERKIGLADLLTDPEDVDIRNVILVLERELPPRLSCILCSQDDVHGTKTWAYVSECKRYGCHVFCFRDLIKKNFKVGTRPPITPVDSGEKAMPHKNSGKKAMKHKNSEKRVRMDVRLRLIRSPPSSSGGATIYRSKAVKIAKALLSVVIAAIFGDPISMTIAALNVIFA